MQAAARLRGQGAGADRSLLTAISDVALMPGSNPMFGLELGGAAPVETKDGNGALGPCAAGRHSCAWVRSVSVGLTRLPGWSAPSE